MENNFFNYITKQVEKEEVDIWMKIHNIYPEKMELYYDFCNSLFLKITSTYLYTCRATKFCSRLKSWRKASRDFFFSLVTNLNFYGNIQQWLLFHLKGLQTLIAAIRNVFLERSFLKFQSFYDDFFLLLPSRAFQTQHAVVEG